MFVKIDDYIIDVEKISYIYYSANGRAYFVKVGETMVEITEEQGDTLLNYIHNRKGITILNEGD